MGFTIPLQNWENIFPDEVWPSNRITSGNSLFGAFILNQYDQAKRKGWSRSELMKRRELFIHLQIVEEPKHPRVMTLMCTDDRIIVAEHDIGTVKLRARCFSHPALTGEATIGEYDTAKGTIINSFTSSFRHTHTSLWKQWTLLSCKNYSWPDCHALRNQVCSIAAEKTEWEKYAPGLPGKRAWNGSWGHPGSWKVHWTKKY